MRFPASQAQSVLEDPAVLEPLYRLDKVPGDNPTYYCDLGPLGRLLDVKDFTVIPNPSDTSFQHSLYLSGSTPRIHGLDLLKLSITVWPDCGDKQGPFKYRLRDTPWIYFRENFQPHDSKALGWAEMIAENVLGNSVVKEGLYRVRAELLLPNQIPLLCMVGDVSLNRSQAIKR
ncbi:hypothetical protein LOZ65_000073 [Ophidiomyces ophidiicola]|nr:hypothetical protein LOZ65_000073 [Ophidiomyces ophidiicola]